MSKRNRRYHARVLTTGILLLGTSGAWLSGQLVKQHANLWGAGGANAGLFMRMCQAAERAGFDCAATVKGPWGQFVLPIPRPTRDWGLRVQRVEIPVAFLGLAYFVFVVVWFAFAGGSRSFDGPWRRVSLSVALCGAAASIGFMGLMALGRAPWCLWCVAIHLINFMMLAAIWRLDTHVRHEASQAATDISRPPTVRDPITTREATRAVAFALILVAGLWMYRHEHLALGSQMNKLRPYKALVTSLKADPEFVLREHYAQPMRAIPPRIGEWRASDAPRLTVFTDFECPACFCNSQVVRTQISKAFGGRLSIDVRHFPLCRDCNDGVKRDAHPNACDAAHAAEAARLQGGHEAFERMYELLFKNRNRLRPDIYGELAERIGLDADRLSRDMRGDQVAQIIQSDIELARRLGVRGTPTMFLNGRRVTELCEGEVFWKAVAESSAANYARGGRAQTPPAGELPALTANDPLVIEGGQRP